LDHRFNTITTTSLEVHLYIINSLAEDEVEFNKVSEIVAFRDSAQSLTTGSMPPKPPTARLTHFLMIPLLTPTSIPQLRSSLTTFREKVTTTRTAENPDGVPEKAVRPLGTLHLTLGVMSLVTPELVQSALEILKGLDLKEILLKSGAIHQENGVKAVEPQTQTPGLTITLQGIESMHDPSSTSVLFAPPIPSPQLTTFCQSLKQAFLDAKLMVEDTRPLLLHATILNTIYVPGVRDKTIGKAGHGKRKARLTINAEEILQDHEDFVWMKDVKIEKVAICRMGAQKVEDEELGEEYVVEESVLMP
jgi:activating signal cointegrator complex subunit 1